MSNRLSGYETALSQGIRVEVQSFYVPDQSDAQARRFLFGYRVKIANDSDRRVQLLSRHWIITDGGGRVEEVQGPGVIGQTPSLEPGQEFDYESFCPLTTPTGAMRGTYQMVYLDTGDRFDAEIPTFFLIEPSSFH